MIIHPHFKKTKAKKLPKAVREQHDQWLESVKSQTTNFALSRKVYKPVASPVVTKPYIRETKHYPSLNTGAGVATKAAPKVYTGDKMLGIATLHKSNAVPVFNNTEAVEISSMRR